jgi:hypothetical protein
MVLISGLGNWGTGTEVNFGKRAINFGSMQFQNFGRL